MAVIFILYFVLLGVGLRGGMLKWDEAGLYITVWASALLICLAARVPYFSEWMAVVTVFLDSILIFRVLGQSIGLRR